MAEPKSFKVGQAPWEQTSSPQAPQSFKVGQAPWESGADAEKSVDATGAVRTGARSALEMITLGASEPALSAVSAVDKTWTQGIEALRKKIHDEGGSDFDVIEAIKKNYHDAADSRRKDKSDHPVANAVGGIAGALTPAGPANAIVKTVTGGIGKAVAPLAKFAPEISAATKVGRAANAAVDLGGRVAKGAVEAAGVGMAVEAPRQAIGRATGHINKGDADALDIRDVGKVGAVIGAGIPVVGATLRGGTKASGAVGKKLMATFLGPSEEHINFYLKNPGAVNSAKSVTELKDKVDNITESLRAEVQKGELSVVEAKAQLRDLEMSAARHRFESNHEYQVTATEIRQQFRAAKEALDKALDKATDKLKKVPSPLELADETVQASRDLKTKVSEGSQAAQELIQPGQTIDTMSPYKALNAAKERLNIAGKGPATPEAQAAQGQIDKLFQMIGNLPSKLSGDEAKKLIMQLDQSERAIYTSGEYTDDVSNAYKTLRRAIDEQLKAQNPKYAEAMKSVAANRQLMDVAPARDKSEALSLLNRVTRPTAKVEREALAKLGSETGRDFETPIAQYEKAQSTLKDPAAIEGIKRALPESKAVDELQTALSSLEGPAAKREFIERQLKESGLPAKQASAEAKLSAQQSKLAEAESKIAPFKNINPRNSQQTLERAGSKIKGEERIALKKQLDDLSKMSDTDFFKEVQNLRTKKAFEGTDINGSRKTNLFAVVLGSLGGATAGIFGPGGVWVGAGVGASLGAVADKYGPQTAKLILDGVIKMKGSPTLQKINALTIPKEAKAFLSREFTEFGESNAGTLQKVSDEPDSAPEKGPSKWASDGFAKVSDSFGDKDKAEMLADPKAKKILIEISDLAPGSKAYEHSVNKLKAHWKGRG